MKWFLEEAVQAHSKQILHGDEALFLGSCFSEHILQMGRKSGFHFSSTKFGTIFHPLPIARILAESISETEDTRILERDGRYYSWDAYSKFNANSKKELLTKIEEERKGLYYKLKQAKFLFLTFGTAKAYTNSDGIVVANCHKMPAEKFREELTDLTTLIKVYTDLVDKIKGLNPELEIVLTVSPVRHAKEGLVVNNRSKARLLLMCEELAQIKGVSYFPAYEMVMDELRDYRFFTEDLVHPNNAAVKYVWKKFQEVYIADTALKIAKQVEKYRSYFEHIPLNEENENELKLRSRKTQELKDFLASNPKISW